MTEKALDEKRYWDLVRDRAAELGSDGCTGATGYNVDACLLHDIMYRTHRDMDGTPVTKAQADARFRANMQRNSKWGWYSPVAWTRWSAVRLFGQRAWDNYKEPVAQ